MVFLFLLLIFELIQQTAPMNFMLFLKLVSAIFYQIFIFIFSLNDRPSKTMNYVFYFI